jgi:hypothetical protein
VSAKNNPNENDLHAKVRSVNLDAPTLVDQIGAELLDHLIACRSCLLIFVAQEDSIGDAGCIEGIRIVSQSQLTWQERRSSLAIRHLTEQTMDDFLFDRFIRDERQAIEHHLRSCSQCLQEIHQRATLIALIKASLSRREETSSSGINGVVQVRVSDTDFSACFKNKLGKDL